MEDRQRALCIWRRRNRPLAPVDGGKTFPTVRPLFSVRVPVARRFFYAVSPDGERFLINTLPQQAAATPFTVIVNWPASVKN